AEMGAVCCLILARHAASLLGCKGAISTLSFRRRPAERQIWRGLAPDSSATAASSGCVWTGLERLWSSVFWAETVGQAGLDRDRTGHGRQCASASGRSSALGSRWGCRLPDGGRRLTRAIASQQPKPPLVGQKWRP